MKFLTLMMVFLASCASEPRFFKRDKVCSERALRYLKNPRNKEKRAPMSRELISSLTTASQSVQKCYENFRDRTGVEEFNTCMVVGVDAAGEMEFYNFGTQEVELDQEFLRCTENVTASIPFGTFGRNYILIQSFRFFVNL